MDEGDLAIIETIYDALDGGRPERALELARKTLAAGGDDDPVLRYLAGRALVELDRPAEAVAELGRAVRLDPDDPEFRTDLAESLFLCCEFADALVEARRAVDTDDELPDAHYVLALCLERCGDPDGAEGHFRVAARLDGERFSLPCRVDDEEFGRQLERARSLLPDAFRRHLDDVGLIVEALPSVEVLREESPPLSPELLGLFTGVPLDARSYLSQGGELPPRIYLFQRNLERHVTRPDELAEQIRVTLYHELGHYLGMDEDDLDEAGYA